MRRSTARGKRAEKRDVNKSESKEGKKSRPDKKVKAR